jgi:hypothetical protein
MDQSLPASDLLLNASSTSLAQAAQESQASDTVSAHHASSVVAFIIGLAIVLLASVLNAAGLNLTKLDHVSVSASQLKARCSLTSFLS